MPHIPALDQCRRAISSAQPAAGPDLPAVAVLGQYRGGTSCTAGMLAKLGVYLGRCLRWPGRANPAGYWESRPLAKLCRRTFDEPTLDFAPGAPPRAQRITQLKRWCDDHRRRASGRYAAVAGKHPLLCLMGPELEQAWGPNVRFIAIERPIRESLASLESLRYWGWPPHAAAAALERLVHERDRFLVDREHLRLHYHDLVERPDDQVDRVVEFLGIPVTPAQRQAAVDFVDPALRRIRTPKPAGEFESPRGSSLVPPRRS